MDCAYHPGKEAAVACVNCGKLICLECKTELAGKNYCPPCANEIFVGKKPAEAVETPAPVAETPAGVAKKPTEDVQAPAGVRKTPAGVRKMPAGATKGPAEVAEEVALTEEKISGAWWLMPVFLTWVGGLVAWVVNRDKAPKRAKSMLIWGIVLTFVYAIIWFLGIWIVALVLGGASRGKGNGRRSARVSGRGLGNDVD